MKKRRSFPLKKMVSVLLTLTLVCLVLTEAAPPVSASKSNILDDLEQQLSQTEQQLAQHRAELEELKKDTANAKKRKKNLENQAATIKTQINLVLNNIATTQDEIGATETAIAEKIVEIEDKQVEIDQRHERFKQRMAAMQELHDMGTIGLLAQIQDMYQLLTFNEVLQDIANKDASILEEMRTAKAELEKAKTELETKRAELKALEAQLNHDKNVLNKKRSELQTALIGAGKDLEEANAAQQEVQDLVDSDELNYEALRGQIEQLIEDAQGNHGDLTFNGVFSCPLRSGSFRISSPYGPRKMSSSKFHYGVDLAAPTGTPIYAAADGYVTAAEYNTGGYGNYVLIYHGKQSDGNTYSTLYAHMDQLPIVQKGQYIRRGTQIGVVGSTGRSTGPHLHLELWQGSTLSNSVHNKAKRINPAHYIVLR